MRSLASFSMQGRSQAVMAATVLAILSLMLPPLSILSAAVVALVTLRQGPRDGALVLALATVACGLLAVVLVGNMIAVAGFVLLLWAPVWLLGLVLRLSRSLGITLTVALLIGVLVLAGQYVQGQDPVAVWKALLQPLVASMVESQLIDAAQSEKLVEIGASWMPGGIVVGFVLQSMSSLFLARWWQAALYNPGGFRTEFHNLRMPKLVALATGVVLVLQLLDIGGLAVTYLYMLLLAAWFLQGLAVVHALCHKFGLHFAWLVVVYGMLFFALVYTVTTLAVVGFSDAWIDIRARMRLTTSGGSDKTG
ncbi:MAG: DUF2232 domain-containing protein [Gammaproteobacteria bacterium]|nr:DUF2232 domain-containing protein [Gammaproteobacteria bacterium]